MSNKTLIGVIAVLIVIFAGVVWFFQAKNKPVENKQVTDNYQQTPGGSVPLSGANQPDIQGQSTTTPQVEEPSMETCQRNFDDSKLKSATVDIKNRTVQINVKDFGVIEVELFDKDAPKTVENFLRLANAGFYDCLSFHRVSKGFVIQGGDPKGDGTGGISAFGAKFADELNAETPSYKEGYKKGVLAMANSGPNTNGSQFFIMLADNETLPHAYTIFGKVKTGIDVVDKIGQVDIIPNPYMGPTDGAPVVPVVMEKVIIK